MTNSLTRPDGLPPGPELDAEGWLAVERDQPRSLWELYRRYGPLFTVRGPGRTPRVYVAEPEAIRQIFVLHSKDLHGQGTNLFRPLVGEGSITFLNGRRHQEARRVMSQAIAAADPHQRGRLMADLVSAEVARIPAGGVPLPEFTNEVTRKVIIRLLLGALHPEQGRDLLGAFDRAVAALHDKQLATLAENEPAAQAAQDRYAAAEADLGRILAALLTAHRAGSHAAETTILDQLLDSPAVLSDAEVVCYLMTILVSGQETTSSSLAWALCHLAQHPAATTRLRAELAAADARDPAGYPALPYLQAVCQETLRHSSPVPNGSAQKVRTEFHCAGHTFPAGVEIVPSICVAHQRETPFADPADFRPERFLDQRYHNHEYLPFSVGVRYCPGSAMANQELSIALAMIMRDPAVRIDLPPHGVDAITIGPTVRVPGNCLIRRAR
ncbi:MULTISPECIES: cytochrome P450 [unclassified Crossiella]|uniref:cytochrome P450 n=1 Tax=unclassified Crossiella TaxID=2620835 RepID=UPI001FFFDB40|nr:MULTISPECIES: cytochrome P450 [unclassified Crossiella]MCK2244396.1 cytochrome P450 [Crossiella sp. S99.2]MCK2257776.1 cytochrome P450 [Crossiella sp. S99.1]